MHVIDTHICNLLKTLCYMYVEFKIYIKNQILDLISIFLDYGIQGLKERCVKFCNAHTTCRKWNYSQNFDLSE